jgi:hypothetical protein
MHAGADAQGLVIIMQVVDDPIDELRGKFTGANLRGSHPTVHSRALHDEGRNEEAASLGSASNFQLQSPSPYNTLHIES